MAIIQKIRQKVIAKNYYLSSHAEEEMWEDGLERADVENAILSGRVEKRFTKDPRGTRYRVEGLSLDGRLIHVICRINELGDLIIITVYSLEESR